MALRFLKRPRARWDDTEASSGGAAMGHEGLHEPNSALSEGTPELHLAIASLIEVPEAVDRHQQRVDACHNQELKAVLAHNCDEEKEHAAMLLEYLRRANSRFAEELKDWLFTDRPIGHGHI